MIRINLWFVYFVVVFFCFVHLIKCSNNIRLRDSNNVSIWLWRWHAIELYTRSGRMLLFALTKRPHHSWFVFWHTKHTLNVIMAGHGNGIRSKRNPKCGFESIGNESRFLCFMPFISVCVCVVSLYSVLLFHSHPDEILFAFRAKWIRGIYMIHSRSDLELHNAADHTQPHIPFLGGRWVIL